MDVSSSSDEGEVSLITTMSYVDVLIRVHVHVLAYYMFYVSNCPSTYMLVHPITIYLIHTG